MVVREHPTAVLIWAGAQLVVGVLMTVVMIVMAGPAMTQMLQSQANGAAQDPAESLRLLQQMGPLYLLLLPASLVIYGVIYGAMNRIVLRPQDSAFGYLRLGADELRQMVVLLVIWVIMFAVYLVSFIVVGIFGATVTGATAASGGGGSAAAISALVVVFAIFGVLGALIFVGTKLSLASPQTFATGKINLFGSWGLTKGRFWPIFATYFLAFILLLLMGLLAMVIIGAIMAVMMGAQGAMAMFMKPDMSSIGAYFTLGHIVYLLLVAGFTALFAPVWLTPPAAIYRSLTAGRDSRTVEAVFA
jgi:hypothetical protein